MHRDGSNVSTTASYPEWIISSFHSKFHIMNLLMHKQVEYTLGDEVNSRDTIITEFKLGFIFLLFGRDIYAPFNSILD